jgi:hypothetical protein
MLRKNPQKKRKKCPEKRLYRISIRAYFVLHRAENRKERRNCIVQRYEKKTCMKVIHPCPYHHRAYEIARFIDSRK